MDKKIKEVFFDTTYLTSSYERELEELKNYGFKVSFETSDSGKVKMILKKNGHYVCQFSDMFGVEYFLEGIRVAELIY